MAALPILLQRSNALIMKKMKSKGKSTLSMTKSFHIKEQVFIVKCFIAKKSQFWNFYYPTKYFTDYCTEKMRNKNHLTVFGTSVRV